MKKISLIAVALMLTISVFAQPKSSKENAKQLSAQMVAVPLTQEDTDKNLILKYAIDNNLEVQSTPSGIYYVMEKKGEGEGKPDNQSIITAHYHGMLLDGTVFDSSVERGEPFQFQLGRVIKGWQEAIPMLKKGGKAKFLIPSGLAYGKRNAGKIPPNSVLIFEIELIDFATQAELLAKQAMTDKKLIEDYLAKNKIKAAATDSGIYYVIDKKGEGTVHPTLSSNVKTHYHGMLLNGTVFDSSVDRGEPLEFGLNQVIKGWQEAIPLLTVGGKGTFYIPSALAYGPRGAGGAIPPNAVLIFEVELLGIK